MRRSWEHKRMQRFWTWQWKRRGKWRKLKSRVLIGKTIMVATMIRYELPLIGSNSYSYNSGGFVGVNQLTSKKLKEMYISFWENLWLLHLENTGSQSKPQYSRKSRTDDEVDAGSVRTQDNEMIILGLFREQRQEELYKDRVNQVRLQFSKNVMMVKCS